MIRNLLLLVVLLGTTASTTIDKPPFPPPDDEPAHTIWLVSHGWHTGLVIPTALIPDTIMPQPEFFGSFDYLEVGWGDRAYYMADDPPPILMARAILTPTPSVMHVVGVTGSPVKYFPSSRIVRIRLSNEGLTAMLHYIGDELQRNDSGQAVYLGKGLYGRSRFYASKSTYHALRTCNVWIARALAEAGCPISPVTCITAGQTILEAETFGKRIR